MLAICAPPACAGTGPIWPCAQVSPGASPGEAPTIATPLAGRPSTGSKLSEPRSVPAPCAAPLAEGAPEPAASATVAAAIATTSAIAAPRREGVIFRLLMNAIGIMTIMARDADPAASIASNAIRSVREHRARGGGFEPQAAPAGALRSAQRRNPALATAGEIAVGVRRLVFRDKLALFLGLASLALAIAFFALLGSIGPSSHGAELPISRVVSLAEHRQVAAATLLDHDSRVEIALKPAGAGAGAGTGRHPAGLPRARTRPRATPRWPHRRSSRTGPPTRPRARRRRRCCRR